MANQQDNKKPNKEIKNIDLENPTLEDIMLEDNQSENEKEIDDSIKDTIYADDELTAYIKSIKDIKLLTASEEKKLAKKIQKGDVEAKNEMVKRNLKLVISIAKRYHNDCVTIMDIIQEGNIGLMTAADRFNPDLGFRFSTYATWWIKQAITRSLSNQGRIIRLPVHILEKLNKIKQVQKTLMAENNEMPTEEQIANYLKWPITEVHHVLISIPDAISYDIEIDNSDHGTYSAISDFITDNEQDTAADGEKYVIIDTINQMIETLPEREQNIIKLRMGFKDGRIYTLQEIGDIYGISRERVRQIENKVFDKFRSPENIKILSQLR